MTRMHENNKMKVILKEIEKKLNFERVDILTVHPIEFMTYTHNTHDNM